MAKLIDAMRIDFDEVDISGCTDVDDIIAAVENLIDAQPAVEAYTAEQVSEIIQQAETAKDENGTLRTGLEFLKNCINCKIRNTCPRHCGKVVHGCDHWDYGDPVVHGRWKKRGKNLGECSECGEVVMVRYRYCPDCGARMDGA